MQKKITVVTALILICSLVFTSTAVYVAGSSLDEKKQESKNIKNKIQQEKDALEQGRKEEANLSSQIQELEVRIGEAENQIDILKGKIRTKQGQVAQAKEDLEQAEKDVESQTDNLNVRLRTMYKNGSIGFLDVLLGSGSLSEFISNIDMVQRVHSSDKEVLSDLKERYQAVNEKKKKLESLQAQLETQKSEESEKQAALAADKQEVSKKKASVAAKNEKHEDNIQDLNAEADHIASIIQQDIERAQREAAAKKEKDKSSGSSGGSSGGGSSSGDSSSGSSSGNGKFSWPVPGHTRVSSNYGWRNCPFHGREKHSGIDIPAPYGTSVKAAASGTVIYSGYLGSYGNAIIIRHGNGLYTLYGHNSRLVARSGAKVSKGQTVAKVGSTGSSTGNHCHFEVRKGGSGYGNDVNPWNYL